ncbi:MAG: hypothetical protein EOO16_06410 [Chitinophagaceae bacterium]|nr:MAG: hypothetical protein EOO16_06410 [Chitinophagaceae bacterium]
MKKCYLLLAALIASFVSIAQCTAPVITGAHPGGGTCAGATGRTLGVTGVTGTSPTYEWKKNGVIMSGVTTPTITITNASAADAGDYVLTVSNSCGSAVYTVHLDVFPPAVVTTQPTPLQNLCTGATATLSATVAIAGGFVQYQWQKNGVDIPGANALTYTIPGATLSDAGTYQLYVNYVCGSTYSANAVVNVDAPPVITSAYPGGATCATIGGRTLGVASTTGTNLTYQWKKDGLVMPGVTTPTYVINSPTAADAGNYALTISNGCGTANYDVQLEVFQPAVVTAQPLAVQNLCAGATATFSASVAVSGGFLQYQWKKNGVDVPGATGLTYTIPNATAADAGTYKLFVNYVCGSTTSSDAVLNVSSPVNITTQPTGGLACSGTPKVLSVTATGGSLAYQWKKDGVNIPGATTSAYTISNPTPGDAGIYTVQVGNSCSSMLSQGATVTVATSASIATQPVASWLVCAGGPASFSVTAAGDAPISYQWRKDGADIAGATSATYSIPATTTTHSGTYTVRVANGCNSVVSNNSVLTVSPLVSITSAPAPVTVCAGSPAQFTVTATGVGPTYTWRKDGAVISGAFTNTLTLPNVTAADAGSYTVNVAAACGSVTSGAALLTLNTPTAIIQAPAAATVCAQQPVSFSVLAGGSGTLAYQWRRNGAAISGATANTYTIAATTPADAGNYDVQVSGTCGTVGSTPVALTVNTCTAVSTLDASVEEVLLAPSVVRHAAELRVVAKRSVRIEWQLLTAGGIPVRKFVMTVAPGANTLRLQADGMPAGIYLLQGDTGKGQTRVLRMVKM